MSDRPISQMEIEAEALRVLRFVDRVRVAESGCWEWAGAHFRDGYARCDLDGENVAHRFAFRAFVGPIPEGLTLDHLCRNRGCVNPRHLEPVTMAENLRRGISPSAINARKEQCERGHPFDEENTYRRPDGSRGCRVCRRDAVRRHRLKRLGRIA